MRITSIVALLVVSLGLGSCYSASQLEAQSVSEFAKMRQEMKVSTNAADRAYVRCIADKLVAQLEEPYRSEAWDVELFEDESINAFAMPGGKIGVFTGLFEAAQNQDQLAAVMAHEVAHVTRGHSLKRANSQAATQIGVLAGAIVSETIADNAGLVVMGAQLGLLLPFGRYQESEADYVGLDYMADAGFDPAQSVELWKNMAEVSPSKVPQFLSTHPSSATRIRELGKRVSSVQPAYQQARAAGRRPNCKR